jgi:di/tricarboxylate transporter
MTPDIALVLGILVAAIVLFVGEWLRPDLVALLVLLALVFTGLVNPDEGLSGFANPAVVTIWAVFILSAGLTRTGVSAWLGRQVLSLAGGTEGRLLAALMGVSAALSAFMNNIGVAAMFLPVTTDIARRSRRPVARLLLPMAYACLMGGMLTLIGTSSNLVVNGYLRPAGLEPLGLFDFAPVGSVILASAMGYMLLVGRRLLPERPVPEPGARGDRAAALYGLEERLAMLSIPDGSPLAGETLASSRIATTLGLHVLRVQRRGGARCPPTPDLVLEAGDRLLVLGRLDAVEALDARSLGPAEEALRGLQTLRIERDARFDLRELEDGPFGVVEVMLSPHTILAGKTLRQLHLRERFGVSVLAIWRGDRPYRTGLGKLPLQFGDAFLCHGTREAFELLAREPDFVVLEIHVQELPRLRKAPLASLIMAAVVATALAGLAPIALAAVAGAACMVLTRCLSMEEAYRGISWKAVFLIAAMLPLGLAMQRTGAAALLAEGVIRGAGPFGPTAILAGLMAAVMLVNALIPALANAVVMTPIALAVAAEAGISPYPLVMGVAYAVASSFLTPVSHPVNVLVMSPGGYRFLDYVRNGLPLSLLVLAISVALLPVIFPF